jgi:uncharacterized protein YkwD
VSGARARGAALLLLATGCATSPLPAPPIRAPPALAGETALAPERYGLEPEIALSSLERAAADRLRAALPSGPSRPAVSPSLALAARELARRAAGGDPWPPARPGLRAALAAGLSFDPAPTTVLVVARLEEAPGSLAGAALADGATHLGVGVEVRGRTAWLVLLSARRVAALRPFPREVAVGAAVPLRGDILGLSGARVLVTLPSGLVREAPASGGRPFATELKFESAGRYLVEVVGTGKAGPVVAALLAVSCGGAPLAERPGPAPGPDPAGREAAEAQVLEAIDATRLRHGLAPLAESRELREEARRHSERMLSLGLLAHVLPGFGDVGERLRRARVPFRAAMENIARAGTALAAHGAAEESPAHRANILSPLADRVGCGLARGRLPGGEPVAYLTEIFVQPVDDGSGSHLAPEGRVKEALWRARGRLRLPALLSDPKLDALARQAAQGMLRRDDPGSVDLARQALSLGRETSAADAFVAASAGDAARSKNLADRRFRRVGVGVSQGDSPRYGAGLLWVAVVYTD